MANVDFYLIYDRLLLQTDTDTIVLLYRPIINITHFFIVR